MTFWNLKLHERGVLFIIRPVYLLVFNYIAEPQPIRAGPNRNQLTLSLSLSLALSLTQFRGFLTFRSLSTFLSPPPKYASLVVFSKIQQSWRLSLSVSGSFSSTKMAISRLLLLVLLLLSLIFQEFYQNMAISRLTFESGETAKSLAASGECFWILFRSFAFSCYLALSEFYASFYG